MTTNFESTYQAFMHCDVDKLAAEFAAMYHSGGEERDRLADAKEEVNAAFMRMKTLTLKVEPEQKLLFVCKGFGDVGDDTVCIEASDLRAWKEKHTKVSEAEAISDEMLTFMSTDDIMAAVMKQDLPTQYAFEFCSWEEILSWKLAPSSIYIYGLEWCLSRVLWEMTFFGIEPEGMETPKLKSTRTLRKQRKTLLKTANPAKTFRSRKS